ncbi:hypothetical protein HPB49_016538 [Dermacentor silvarum]|uniref:Uncharacterized protein n=1 Tax=Dermacentor silvarum TaxID=543639 RepID=A0ACB8CLP8_DERSI|nr:hypothetical protein HPB49_016538 [Dermacentor silvarum]
MGRCANAVGIASGRSLSFFAGTVAGLTYQLSLIGNEQGSELLMLDPPRDLLLWQLYLLPPFSYTWALIKTMEKVSEERYCTGDTIDVRDVCAYVHNSLEEGAVLLPNLRYCCANFYASNMTSVRLLPSFSFHRYCELIQVRRSSKVRRPRHHPDAGVYTAAVLTLISVDIHVFELDVGIHVFELDNSLTRFRCYVVLTFSVEPGEALAVVGLRGCGKSTLLNVLSGSTQPTSGTALIGDVPLQNLAEWEQRIGVCPSHDSVLGRLTVRQTLQLYANIRGIRPEDIDRLLEHLVLLLNLTQFVDETAESCGAVTRRKLAVAIAIIGLPPVVLMDDPATGLDLMSKRKIYRTVAQLRRLFKSAVLIVTHSVSDCVVMSDRMAVMREGRFQCLGTVNELRERLSTGTVLLVKLAPESGGDADVLKLVHTLVLKAFPDATYSGWLGRSLEYAVTLSAPWSQLVLRVRDLHSQMVNNVTHVVLTDVTLELGLLKVVKYQKPKRASTPAEDVVA